MALTRRWFDRIDLNDVSSVAENLPAVLFSGPDTYLIVVIQHRDNNAGVTHGSVQYDGNAMTELAATADWSDSRNRGSVWILDSPPAAGSQKQLTASFSAELVSVTIFTYFYTDADDVNAGSVAAGDSAVSTTTITPTDAASELLSVLHAISTASWTPRSPLTEDSDAVNNNMSAAGYHRTAGGTSAVDLVCDRDSSGDWSGIALEVVPTASAPAPITGDLAATGDPDTADGSGTTLPPPAAPVGDLAATEAHDVVAAAGTVDNPYQPPPDPSLVAVPRTRTPSWTRYYRIEAAAGIRPAADPAAGRWDTDVWDDAVNSRWAGFSTTFLELPAHAISEVTIRRGSAAGDPPTIDPGTCRLRLDYPYGAHHRWSWRSLVGPGDHLRIIARSLNPGYPDVPLFRGRIDGLGDGWDPEGRTHGLLIDVTDHLADVTNVTNPPGDPWSAETASARIFHTYYQAGTPDELIDVSAGDIRQIASSAGADPLHTETERALLIGGGLLYSAGDGAVTYLSAWALPSHEPATATQIAWTNLADHGLAVPVAAPLDFSSSRTIADVVNTVTVTRTGGTPQTATDTESQQRHGTRGRPPFTNTLHPDDAAALTTAQRIVASNADRIRHLEPLTALVDLSTPDTAAALVAANPGDLHRIVWWDLETLTDWSDLVRTVQHSITPDQWAVAVTVDGPPPAT